MDTIAVATINTFLPKVEVQPVEEPIFVLTATELRQIITAAVGEATKSILERLTALEGKIASLEERNAVLEAQEKIDINRLQSEQEAEIARVCLDIAVDRRRLAALEQTRTAPPAPPGEKTAARIEQIKSILKGRGPTTFGELERILKISPREMLRITKKLDLRLFEITRRSGDTRQKVLRLRAQIK